MRLEVGVVYCQEFGVSTAISCPQKSQRGVSSSRLQSAGHVQSVTDLTSQPPKEFLLLIVNFALLMFCPHEGTVDKSLLDRAQDGRQEMWK